MALQLRRGTNAERAAITFAEGELVYTTDTKGLYIGDGNTSGGVLAWHGAPTLDGLADTDLTGATNNDVLTYNASTSKWESVSVPGVGVLALTDLSNVDTTGLVNSDLLQFDGVNFVPKTINEIINPGSSLNLNLIADDSTMIVNATTSTFTGAFTGDLTGNVTGNITSTGASTFSSIDVNGGNIDGTVIGAVSSAAGTFTTINTSSNVTVGGELTVNGVTNFNNFGNLVTQSISAGIVTTDSIQSLTAGESIIIKSGDLGGKTLSVNGICSGLFGGEASVTIDGSKGTLASPQDTIANDIFGALKVRGYNNGSQVLGSMQQTSWDASADFSQSFPKSNWRLLVNAGNGNGVNGFSYVDLRHDGVLEGPVFKMNIVANATARDAAITAPEAGMTVFVTDVAKFQGYDGSAWVNLN
jgi:hypothetical protein